MKDHLQLLLCRLELKQASSTSSQRHTLRRRIQTTKKQLREYWPTELLVVPPPILAFLLPPFILHYFSSSTPKVRLLKSDVFDYPSYGLQYTTLTYFLHYHPCGFQSLRSFYLPIDSYPFLLKEFSAPLLCDLLPPCLYQDFDITRPVFPTVPAHLATYELENWETSPPEGISPLPQFSHNVY